MRPPAAPHSAEPASERLYNLAKQRKPEAPQELAPECTFRPQITPLAHKLERVGATHDSLYRRAAEQRQKMAAKRAEAEVAGCTFTPQLSSSAGKVQREGTWVSRLYNKDLVTQRNSPDRNSGEAYMNQQCTFKPQITPHRSPIGTESTRSSPAHSRLYADAQKHAASAKQAAEAARAKEMAECTFAPQISAGSRKQAAQSEDARPASARLYASALQSQSAKRAATEAAREAEYSQFTFSPRLSDASLRMASHARPQDGLQLHERLYNMGVQAAEAQRAAEEAKQAALTAEEQALCTFHPQLSSSSKKRNAARASTASMPVHDRLFANARLKQVADAALNAEIAGALPDEEELAAQLAATGRSTGRLNTARSAASSALGSSDQHRNVLGAAPPAVPTAEGLFLI